MKRTTVALALLATLPGLALAGGHKQPKPAPVPTKQEIQQYMAAAQAQRQAQRQAQAQAAVAGARSGDSVSNSRSGDASSVATNGANAGSASHSGGGGGGEGGNVNSDYSAFAVGLPPPVHVPEMTRATAACALSESGGFSVGWSFLSSSSARQSIDAMCLAERQAAAYEATCKYRTAAAIRYWIATEGTPAEVRRAVAQHSFDDGYPWPAEQRAAVRSLDAFLKEAGARPWENERDYGARECSATTDPAPSAAPIVLPRVRG